MEDDKAVESAKAADNVDKAESVKRPREDSCDGGVNADKHKEGRETRVSPEEKKHKTNDGTAAVSDTVSTGGTDKKAEGEGGEYRPQCKNLFCCAILNSPLDEVPRFAVRSQNYNQTLESHIDLVAASIKPGCTEDLASTTSASSTLHPMLHWHMTLRIG